MVIVSIILLTLEVGWIGLLAPVIFLLVFYLSRILYNITYSIRKKVLTYKDERTKYVTEFFNGIRVIKVHFHNYNISKF